MIGRDEFHVFYHKGDRQLLYIALMLLQTTIMSQHVCSFVFNTLLEAVRHFRSVVIAAGSRVTTVHAHQCCIYFRVMRRLYRANEIDYEIDYAWTSIHDNGHVIMACDVLLQQRI